MQSNKQLDLAFDFVRLTNRNIFLTGKAGTGKTTFLRNLKESLPKRMIVVAPTGVAAINAGGVTIHSFFQLSFGPQIGMENTSPRQMRFSKEKINIIRSLDLLIIDEISMVRADILDAINGVLRRFRNRAKPFGGVQVLMIGDLQQLSPVVKNDEWELLKTRYETAYFFSSKVLRETTYISIELTHVYRQQDDRFISILNKVRDNQIDAETLKALNERHNPNFKPDQKQGYITLCTHNAQAHRINDAHLRQLPTSQETYFAEVEGNFPEYSFPTDYELNLKEGAQVMFVKNDPSPENQFFNGKIGKITRINEEAVYVLCPEETQEIEVTPLLWENMKYSIDKNTAEIKESVEGAFRQMPLKLAWAITIHKSQGLTFEHAIIDAEASFAHGQVYVALSRCKTLEGMVLSTPISKQSIINDGRVSGFIKQVEDSQPGDKELNDARIAYQQDLLNDLFGFDQPQMWVNTLLKLMRENSASVPEEISSYFIQIRKDAEGDLFEVSRKFMIQVDRLLTKNPDIENNPQLQERIAKASVYFSEKVQSVLLDKLASADLEVDNREIKKRLKRVAEKLEEDLELKICGYDVCNSNFRVTEILDARARKMIQQNLPAAKKQKAREVLNPENIPHPELYQLLRSWRNDKATELEKPAFFVFSQKALIEMVNYLPVETATLKLINGLGSKKIVQFGKEILEIIQEYCEDKGLERMDIPLKEARQKATKPKIDTKKISFDLFNEGKTIPEIAKKRSLTESTIEAHLGHYVEKGELDVKRLLPEEKLKAILKYFEKAKVPGLSAAREALGEKYSYGELRIGLSYFLFKKNTN